MAGNVVTFPTETYSSFSFSTGLRVMLRGLFRTREVRTLVGPVTLATMAVPETYDVELEVLDVFKVFYDDLRRGTFALSDAIKTAIMPGRVGQYVAYIMVAAIFVILYVVVAF